MGLNVVPRTEIVYLSAPSFHYGFKDRLFHSLLKTPLPPKIGSFQLFLNEFIDSTTFFSEGYQQIQDGLPFNWTEKAQKDFQNGFERLVILDYLIRNTDRGSDNWMIKVTNQISSSTVDSVDERLNEKNDQNSVQIGAIDNGLAFPFKHPDRIRSYPFGWTLLPIIHTPFSEHIAHIYLPLLTSTSWWSETLSSLEAIFALDSDFKSSSEYNGFNYKCGNNKKLSFVVKDTI